MYTLQYTEHLNRYQNNNNTNLYSYNVVQSRQKWYIKDPTVRRCAEEYSTLRQDIQRRNTETQLVKRLGGKTHIITQSQKHTLTIWPWVTVITSHQEYSVSNAVYAVKHQERLRWHEELQTQFRSKWLLPYGQPHVETHNAVHKYIAYSEESSHENSVSDTESDVSFTFDLSFHKTNSEEEEHEAIITDSFNKSNNKESEKSTITDENKYSSYNETVYSVLHSWYINDIYAWENTIAELTTEQNQKSFKRDLLSLLWWMYMLSDSLYWSLLMNIYQSSWESIFKFHFFSDTWFFWNGQKIKDIFNSLLEICSESSQTQWRQKVRCNCSLKANM